MSCSMIHYLIHRFNNNAGFHASNNVCHQILHYLILLHCLNARGIGSAVMVHHGRWTWDWYLQKHCGGRLDFEIPKIYQRIKNYGTLRELRKTSNFYESFKILFQSIRTSDSSYHFVIIYTHCPHTKYVWVSLTLQPESVNTPTAWQNRNHTRSVGRRQPIIYFLNDRIYVLVFILTGDSLARYIISLA